MLISFAGAALVPTLAFSAPNLRPATITSVAPVPSDAALVAAIAAEDEVGTVTAKLDPVLVAPAAPALDEASVECIAKIVRHEAANQSELGQLAVAQLVVARTQAGSRFGRTPCAVANQPGQFFRTASYNPDRDSLQWSRALRVSRDALGGVSPAVVPGALFYHAKNMTASRFFRGRQRVAVLGDHAFYR